MRRQLIYMVHELLLEAPYFFFSSVMGDSFHLVEQFYLFYAALNG
ncbi:MAG TPA: hypothetical protein VJB05_03300 [archaeon]|nr:hypothetical protein [archaeon]